MGCCGEGCGCPLGWMSSCSPLLRLFFPSHPLPLSYSLMQVNRHPHLKSHRELNWLLEKAIEAKEDTDRKHSLGSECARTARHPHIRIGWGRG